MCDSERLVFLCESEALLLQAIFDANNNLVQIAFYCCKQCDYNDGNKHENNNEI